MSSDNLYRIVLTSIAAAVLVGLLGTALTWWERSALFDLAASSGDVVKMDTGYLAGPVAILVNAGEVVLADIPALAAAVAGWRTHVDGCVRHETGFGRASSGPVRASRRRCMDRFG